jgi:hypothetical protein
MDTLKRRPGRPAGIAPHLWITGTDPLHHKMYVAYNFARGSARYRKEEWQLTWEDFRDTWEPIWHLRGIRADQLCWSRVDPEKPWHRDNVEVLTRREHGKRVRELYK